MKKLLSIIILFLLIAGSLFSQVAINADGSAPDPSAGLDVNYTDKGFLLPRLSFEQRNAIANPAEGLLVFCTDCSTSGTGVISIFQGGRWNIIDLKCYNPITPSLGTIISSVSEITWDWTNVPIAVGYKWNDANDYNSATDLGLVTSFTETGLDCNTSYTRYFWSYNDCGQSAVLTLTESTQQVPFTFPPAEGVHVPTLTSILWNWDPLAEASGYKWNTTADYNSAIDLGNNTSTTETGLDCGNNYTRYVWAYNSCGVSASTVLTKTTLSDPNAAPETAAHIPAPTEIVWNWHPVFEAVGYKWNTFDDYGTATDVGTDTTFAQTGLDCFTVYNLYIWAYNGCAVSLATTLTQSTTQDTHPAPVPTVHLPSPTQIVWNWHLMEDHPSSFKWGIDNDFETAQDLGEDTSFTEIGLECFSSYIRYIWAYDNCAISESVQITQATTEDPPANPVEATHVPAPTEIVWNWDASAGATGYMWNTTNDFGTATDLGNVTSNTETELTCITSYSRYIWAYGDCGISASTTLTQLTSEDPPDDPVSGTHVPSPGQIVWNWNVVTGATGYKWNTSNNYGSATNIGSNNTLTETGLTCGVTYTRYLWAYGDCGVSSSTMLSSTTTTVIPTNPGAGTHVPAATQIIWNWSTVPDATAYKWNTTNDFASATDMGALTTKTETNLECGTGYTRYVWAYNDCEVSAETVLSSNTTTNSPAIPTVGNHEPAPTSIMWDWNTVAGASGYKWSMTNNYANATDVGASTALTETDLTCNTGYTRYAWAYNTCGNSTELTMTASTADCEGWTCGASLTIDHIAGNIAPVDKTVTYGTVNNIPGLTTKCWITNNLGSDHQATAATDATEASAGWYWQFNNLQGFKHDGTTRTPASEWITEINDYSNWIAANDPCTNELGTGWRIPTAAEWTSVDAEGGWVNYNGPWNSDLKMHNAGRLDYFYGTMGDRGSKGYYWSSTQTGIITWSQSIFFSSSSCTISQYQKTYGNNLRCLQD